MGYKIFCTLDYVNLASFLCLGLGHSEVYGILETGFLIVVHAAERLAFNHA